MRRLPIGFLCLVSLLLHRHCLAETGAASRDPASRARSGIKARRLTAPMRMANLQPDRLMDIMRPGLKDGSAVLDVGGGAGSFTFLFSEEVGEQGKVFVTETDPAMIAAIEQRIEEQGYNNVFPVLVQKSGVDPFYREHAFDVLFLANVYDYLFDPEVILRELRPSLKKAGRLFILHQRNDGAITEDELDDPKKIVATLAGEEEDYPFSKRLGETTRRLIRTWGQQELPDAAKQDILSSFNSMLSDPTLYADLGAYYYRRGARVGTLKIPRELVWPADAPLLRLFAVFLDESRAFEQGKILDERDMKMLRMLNRILITGRFGQEPLVPASRPGMIIFAEREAIMRTAARAGYRFVRGYDFLPKHYFLEFEAAPPTGGPEP